MKSFNASGKTRQVVNFILFPYLYSFRDVFVKYTVSNPISSEEFDKVLMFIQGRNSRREMREKNQSSRIPESSLEAKLMEIRQEYLKFLSIIQNQSNFFDINDPSVAFIEGSTVENLLKLLATFIFEQFYCSLTVLKCGNQAVALFSTPKPIQEIVAELKTKFREKKRLSKRRMIRSQKR